MTQPDYELFPAAAEFMRINNLITVKKKIIKDLQDVSDGKYDEFTTTSSYARSLLRTYFPDEQ